MTKITFASHHECFGAVMCLRLQVFFEVAPWSHALVFNPLMYCSFCTSMTTLSVGLRRAGFTGDDASLNVLVRILRELHLYVIEDLHVISNLYRVKVSGRDLLKVTFSHVFNIYTYVNP